jgi:transposase
MPKGYHIPQCSEKDRLLIEEWAKSRTMESRLVERAKIIQRCLNGEPIKKIVRDLQVRPNTVIDWRRRFDVQGIAGLTDLPRSGKPPKYTVEFRNEILATLEKPPPLGQSVWDGPAVAKHLGASVHAVWRVLRKEGICLSRQRSWCVSTDPEFSVKAADIIGLYLNPPEKALVISVDEKPSIQALERSTGYVETDNGKIVRGLKSTHKRHGTLNLFAALEVATGAVHTETTKLKRRVEFLEFMDKVMTELPADREVHVSWTITASIKETMLGWRHTLTSFFISLLHPPVGLTKWKYGLALCPAKHCEGQILKAPKIWPRLSMTL